MRGRGMKEGNKGMESEGKEFGERGQGEGE